MIKESLTHQSTHAQSMFALRYNQLCVALQLVNPSINFVYFGCNIADKKYLKSKSKMFRFFQRLVKEQSFWSSKLRGQKLE